MRPNRGTCLGVFLLSYVNRLKVRENGIELIGAARSLSAYMTAALDFENIVANLERLQLLDLNGGRVEFMSGLSILSFQADKRTLVNIAKIILVRNRPVWLRFAIREGCVSREYIPQSDLDELEWIDDDELDELLIEVYSAIYSVLDDEFRERFGAVAELIVMESLRLAGYSPLHVSKISDVFGYDIEYFDGTGTRRLEVKAASMNTQGRFFITRNEFEKCKRYKDKWSLLQITFSNDAFTSKEISQKSILRVLQLKNGKLESLVPNDTPHFIWQDAAKVITLDDMWDPISFPITSDFSYSLAKAGFKN